MIQSNYFEFNKQILKQSSYIKFRSQKCKNQIKELYKDLLFIIERILQKLDPFKRWNYLMFFPLKFRYFVFSIINCKQKNYIMKKQQYRQPIVPEEQEDISEEEESSAYSSEDQDAYLLTQKVEQKIMQTVARLKSRDPSIYQVEKPIFQDDDFQAQEKGNKDNNNAKNKKDKKFTYKDLLTKNVQSSQEDDDEQLPPAMEEKKAKNKFRLALQKQKQAMKNQQSSDDLFTVKSKLKKVPESQLKLEQKDAYQQFITKMKPQTQKLIKSVWSNQAKMDQTDLFLRDYILTKKWLSKHANDPKVLGKGDKKGNFDVQKIDEEDQQRSVQMDEFEAKYNFRFQEPQGDKIVQYPRKIQDSLRLMPESRKDKRKKTEQRKKQEQKVVRKQAQQKKKQLRDNILQKIQQKQLQNQQNQQNIEEQQQDFDHDWFFCDDCGKAFQQQQTNYQCEQCEDYMLCQQCFDLIIHKHPLIQGSVPQGYGAPKESISSKILSKLQPCKTCRRKLPETLKHFEHRDRSQNVTLMCQKCYDQAGLDIKKKFNPVQPKININNIEQILEKDPQKVKELTNSKEIEEMVDEYLKYEFEDVIAGGVKTKFRYMNVKPESFGLSDEQILFGDDKELNNYVSVKKLAPYRDQDMKLRNNIYNKKIKTIDRSVKQNKKLLDTEEGIERRIKKTRIIDKLKRRSQVMKNKRQTKLRVLNLSNPQKQKRIFVPTSRLASYGVTLENKFMENKILQNAKKHAEQNAQNNNNYQRNKYNNPRNNNQGYQNNKNQTSK